MNDPPDAAHDAGEMDGSTNAGTGGSGHDGGGAAGRDSEVDSGGGGSDGGATDAGGRDTGMDPTATIEPLVAPGTRLEVLRGEDGVRFRSFIDTMHDDMACEFRKVGETYYCIPLRGASAGRYADADCTEPVTFVQDGECFDDPGPGELVLLRGTEVCASVMPMRLGESTFAGPVYSDETGDCLEVDAHEDEGAWYPLEAVSLSELASATEQIIEAGDVSVRRLVAADGATLNLEVLAPGGKPCVHVRDRCVPGTVAYATGGLYTDPECMDETPVANASFRCEEAFDYVLRYDDERECDEPFYEVYEAASVVDEGHRSIGGVCTPSTGKFVVAGDPVSDDALIELRTELVGEGRIRAYATANAEGVPLLPASSNPYDTELEATCIPYAFADGETRCITGAISNLVDIFTDDECTDAMGVATMPAECAAEEAARHYLYSAADAACGAMLIERLFEPMPFDGQLYRLEDTGTCVPTTAGPGSAFVATGAEVPLSKFATL